MQSPAALEPDSISIAAQLLSTAIPQAQQLKDVRALAYALGMQGRLYEQTQQWSLAKDFTQRALWPIENAAAARPILPIYGIGSWGEFSRPRQTRELTPLRTAGRRLQPIKPPSIHSSPSVKT